MLKIQNLHLQRGSKVLLDNANATINFGQKVGIVGRNGCGKSSFFALICRELDASSGAIDFPPSQQLAHLEQEITELDKIALDYVIDGDKTFRMLEQGIREAEDTENHEALGDHYENMQHIDGFSIKARVAEILTGLGFKHNAWENTVGAFSGGWQMRLNLARTLISRADILLLDEPTNHLDLEAIVWLESWLAKYNGTVLMISHDRDFLDNVANTIMHFEAKSLTLYSGNYTEFCRLFSLKQAHTEAQQQKQAIHRQHLEKFINRFRAKASKAKQAQSKIKQLEKMQDILLIEGERDFTFKFQGDKNVPNPICQFMYVTLGYGDHRVLKNINFSILAGDRIGVLGLNGAGKSTLIAALAKELQPLDGECFFNPKTKVGYFAQHQLSQLNADATPLETMQLIAPSSSVQQLRDYLGRFGFKSDRVNAHIHTFSGGEKARLVLATIIWHEPNLLLLDEPTNHFDMSMRDSLTLALQEYEGALMVISHDRHLIKAAADTLWLVHDGDVNNFDGDMDDYTEWLNEQMQISKRENSARGAKIKGEKKNKVDLQQRAEDQKRFNKIEKELRTTEIQLQKINETLENVSTYDDENKHLIEEHLQQQAKLTKKISELEEEWLSLNEALSRNID